MVIAFVNMTGTFAVMVSEDTIALRINSCKVLNEKREYFSIKPKMNYYALLQENWKDLVRKLFCVFKRRFSKNFALKTQGNKTVSLRLHFIVR